MEPSEGHYDFDWLDRAINLADKHHIVSVLGTPTATPPAWLTQKYPDDPARGTGRSTRHPRQPRARARPHSPRYREFCRRIAEQMATRFGHNPNVVGWQIDNEYGYALMSYDDVTRQQFQDWLKAKYKTLDSLNDALDHLVLEPDLRQLARNSHSHWRAQPRVDARLETLRAPIPGLPTSKIRLT